MTETQRLVDLLIGAGVEFVIIGGVAMVLRGSSRTTIDLLMRSRYREVHL